MACLARTLDGLAPAEPFFNALAPLIRADPISGMGVVRPSIAERQLVLFC